MTVKHGHAAVYANAESLDAANKMARDHVLKHNWIILSVEVNGIEYNPELHNLPDEAKQLYYEANICGVSMGVAAVGFDPSGAGKKS